MARGKEGKVKSGIDETSSLIMINRLNYADIPAIVFDILTIDKVNGSEEETERLKRSLAQLRKLKVTSIKVKEEFESFLEFVVNEIKKDFNARKKDLYDGNGFLKIDLEKLHFVDACYVNEKMLIFYQVEKRQKRTELDSIKNHLDEELEEEVETDE